MMKHFCRIALIALCAGSLASCYYPGGYDSGYGGYADTYGYSGGGTTFIHTSSNRWFYDSSVRCYYDRTRHCYYDPWLNGYYPRGYCPRPVAHVPHPYGWSGKGACPVPYNVNHRQIDRYKDRVALLHAKNHAWARNVKAQHQANARNWQQQRAKQASQFANHRQQPSRGSGMTRPSTNQPPIANRPTQRDRSVQNTARPSGPSNSPFRPQAQPNSGSRPQAGSPPRRPSTPSTSRSRPGYNQPVSAQPSRSQPTSTPRSPQVSRPQPRAQPSPSAPAAPSNSRARGASAAQIGQIQHPRSARR